jgi:hypothetical protein
LLPLSSFDFKVAGSLSSSSLESYSLITDKLFESGSYDCETEEDSLKLLDDTFEIEESCFFATCNRFSLTRF